MDIGRARKRPICRTDGCDKTVWRAGKCRGCNYKEEHDPELYDWVVVDTQWRAGLRDDDDPPPDFGRQLTWRERAELVRRADRRRMSNDDWCRQTGLHDVYLRRWREHLDKTGMRLSPRDNLTALKWSGYAWAADEESALLSFFTTAPALRGLSLFGHIDAIWIIVRAAVTQQPSLRQAVKNHRAGSARFGERFRETLRVV